MRQAWRTGMELPMIVRYSDNSAVHGVLYRLTRDTLRAGLEGEDDATEFKLIRGAWTSDKGAVVTFEFPIETGMDLFQTMPAERFQADGRCVAGGDCVFRRLAASGGSKPAN
jgi:hypothetical protein